MNIRMAFAGFRHGHIFDLHSRAIEASDIDVVAACEEHAATREELTAAGSAKITYTRLDDMLASCDCDVVAIGDYYGNRGRVAIAALQAGKHIIVDKPLCTSLDELDRIEQLSRETGLKVGCMLSMRDAAPFRTMRRLVQDGTIGEVHAVGFGGQHPLLLGKRPGWYFEPGKHGGTINDIAIHGLDVIPWLTGLQFARVDAARCWNALATDCPHFEDAGQMMLTMTNDAGVLGDVSYFAPDSCGYKLPFYWRVTLWGRAGVMETYVQANEVTVVRNGDDGLHSVALDPETPGGYLEAFLNDIKGTTQDGQLCTTQVLHSTRVTLTTQHAADTGQRDVNL